MPNRKLAGTLGWTVRQVPTVLVFAALAGTAYWGHRTGWKVPAFASLGGQPAATAEKEDWCEAHNVPDSKCLACYPELGGADPKDWCKEHGVPESKCTVCHPEILTTGKAADWCKEHGVPESQCNLCHPEIVVKGEAPKDEGEATVSLDPAARPAPNPLTCQTHAIRVQFASPDAVRKTGVALAAVQERAMAASLKVTGEVEYDQTRVARLAARAAGSVFRVDKTVGDRVVKGEVVALVEAAEVGRAKAELLQAMARVEVSAKTLERLKVSAKEGFRTQAELVEAEAALREARIQRFNAEQALLNLGLPVRVEDLEGLPEADLAGKVRLLGLPESVTKTLDQRTTTANLLPVLAPFEGVVVSREVVAGEVKDPSEALLVVADLSRMWIQLEVRLEDAGSLATGQTVVFRPDGATDGSVQGRVSWISSAADEKTRTVKVRAEVANPQGNLRAHTFGTGRIVLRESPNAIAVPDEAVHWEGCCHVVFVRLTDEIFQTRKVRLGTRSGGFTEVLAGVAAGEVVATTGSHVLKSEILKSKLGAGCVDD